MREYEKSPVIALAGNPNVGKSTLFNSLTGLNQHTGNWPGKTVSLAQGKAVSGTRELTLVDLPGTYSLRSRSREERVTEDFLRSGEADCVIAVCDASCLERNLILVQQILQLTPNVVVCVNLMDEARRGNTFVDCPLLETLLGVPVVPTSAGIGQGIGDVLQAAAEVIEGERLCTPVLLQKDSPPEAFARRAQNLTDLVVRREKSTYREMQLKLDRLLTNPMLGFPLMGLLLLVVVWLTVAGANYPSRLLELIFERFRTFLHSILGEGWLSSLLLDGVYATVTRVISVMLPPMAIFFPLFTLLEDVGYLPRVAFLLDGPLATCGACGKQALTMCMGLGCNAVGVTGCRIIDSPRERLLAMVTNSFLPCNGRFPTLILLASLFFGSGGLTGAAVVTGLILLGAAVSMAATAALNKTLLRGESSAFLLELPPFRRPRVGEILARSLLDRTLFVAGRAVAVAAPAGALLWLCGTLSWNGQTALEHLAVFLNPLGTFLGLDGAILLAFLFALPANELMTPVLIMTLTGATLLGGDLTNLEVGAILFASGWTKKKAICTMAFAVFHWPCTTTLLTVYKESGKLRYAALALCLPTLAGIFLCMLLRFLL